MLGADYPQLPILIWNGQYKEEKTRKERTKKRKRRKKNEWDCKNFNWIWNIAGRVLLLHREE